jgi:hypothetical protein
MEVPEHLRKPSRLDAGDVRWNTYSMEHQKEKFELQSTLTFEACKAKDSKAYTVKDLPADIVGRSMTLVLPVLADLPAASSSPRNDGCKEQRRHGYNLGNHFNISDAPTITWDSHADLKLQERLWRYLACHSD